MLASMRAYFGHHKCATTWTIAVLRGVCRDLYDDARPCTAAVEP